MTFSEGQFQLFGPTGKIFSGTHGEAKTFSLLFAPGAKATIDTLLTFMGAFTGFAMLTPHNAFCPESPLEDGITRNNFGLASNSSFMISGSVSPVPPSVGNRNVLTSETVLLITTGPSISIPLA